MLDMKKNVVTVKSVKHS